MDDYECEVCGKHLSGDNKIIIYSESPYWDGDEKHVFFCSNLHASKYMWSIAKKYGAYNPHPNYFFWSRTVTKLEEEIDEYEIEQEEQEEQEREEEEFLDGYDDYDEDEEIVTVDSTAEEVMEF